MKQLLLILAVVMVGCGKKEPELRSEKVITPNEAANKLFVEAVQLISSAEEQTGEAAIKDYEQALENIQKIIAEYSESDLAVKLISGETLFTGKSLREIKERVAELRAAQLKEMRRVELAFEKLQAERKAKLYPPPEEMVEKAIRSELNKPKGKLTNADLERVTVLSIGPGPPFLTDLKPLAKLTQLEELILVGNQLTDVKGLAKLTQLEELILVGNQLTDVKELEKLTKLEKLFIYNNQLTNVKGLESLTELGILNLHGNQLTDVKGLENLTQLTELSLHGNQLTDVKGLEKLTQLRELNLALNKLTTVKGLEKLTQLEKLYLRDNPDLTKAEVEKLQKALPQCLIFHDYLTNEETIEALIRAKLNKPTGELTTADLAKIKRFEFRDFGDINQIADVKPLEKLPQLKSLILDDNKLTDVKGLEKLTQLKRLYLRSNQLTDVKGLEKLTQLKELHLSNNQLTDVKGLEKLTQLMDLDLINNKLTDVKGLKKLNQLTSLHLFFNPDLTKDQIAELEKALPKCFIHSNPKKQKEPTPEDRYVGSQYGRTNAFLNAVYNVEFTDERSGKWTTSDAGMFTKTLRSTVTREITWRLEGVKLIITSPTPDGSSWDWHFIEDSEGFLEQIGIDKGKGIKHPVKPGDKTSSLRFMQLGKKLK